MEEVLDSSFIANESEPLVDEQSSDSAGWHTEPPPFRTPKGIPWGTRPVTGDCGAFNAVECVPAEASRLAEPRNPGQSRQFNPRSQAKTEL
jgi:hypothetical protein